MDVDDMSYGETDDSNPPSGSTRTGDDDGDQDSLISDLADGLDDASDVANNSKEDRFENVRYFTIDRSLQTKGISAKSPARIIW